MMMDDRTSNDDTCGAVSDFDSFEESFIRTLKHTHLTTQGKPMTDAQIEAHFDALYLHFEYGEPAPQGVVLKNTLRRTVGRYWQADENGLNAHQFA